MHRTQTAEAVLACPMKQPNDAEAPTVRAYLIALLRELWQEGEGFSGKRPFGNSSWENEIYDSLGQAGIIHATFDEDGYCDGADTGTADKLIFAAIESLGGGS